MPYISLPFSEYASFCSDPTTQSKANYTYRINLTLDELEIMKKIPGFKEATREIGTISAVYPYDTVVGKWTMDNYGPIWIPRKGATIPLTPANLALYRRCITNYEHNTLEELDGKIFLNGREAKEYTFQMDYFWMMGDNRHKSQDSRFWGFVPEDHIVGEASLIWLSVENGIRWKSFRRNLMRSDFSCPHIRSTQRPRSWNAWGLFLPRRSGRSLEAGVRQLSIWRAS